MCLADVGGNKCLLPAPTPSVLCTCQSSPHASLAASAQAQAANPQVAALPAQMAQLQTQMGELQTQQGQLQTQLAALAGLPAQMTHLVAMVANKRRRSRNTQAAAAYPQESPALAPLAKEQTPAANAPNAAPVGAMPPPGLLPPTWEALLEVGT